MPRPLTAALKGRRVIVVGGSLAGLAAARDIEMMVLMSTLGT